MAWLIEQVLKDVLIEGTSLVQAAAAGSLSVVEFIKRYDDFYYYNALDGHEENEKGKDLLARFADVVDLHRHVQEEIVDRIYLGDSSRSGEFKAAGRLEPQVAAELLIAAANAHDVSGLMKRLR